VKIRTISYRRTMQVRAFESITFEAQGELEEGDSPGAAAAALADNVDGWCAAAVDLAQRPRNGRSTPADVGRALDAL
jgi:hypothetical protein